MPQKLRFPFRLSHAFFTSLKFFRNPEVPNELQLQLSTAVRVLEGNFPERLEIHLKLETLGEPPLMFSIELVGLFDLIEGEPEPERSIIPNFVNERALYMLWPYLSQIVRNITGQMGTNPLDLPAPFSFEIPRKKLLQFNEAN